MSLLEDNVMGEYLKKCVRCGQCRYVCPVLEVAGKESASPRGKVFLAGLLQRGEVKPGPQADRILSLCLTCGACAAECPSGLPVDTIIKSARNLSASVHPHSPHRIMQRSLFSKLRTLEKFPGFMPLLRYAMAREYGLKPGSPARSVLPVITSPKRRKPRIRVGYFLGCATNYILPGIARSVVGVLTHLGCEVVIPPTSHCCGIPLVTAGEAEAAARLLEINRRSFKSFKLDAVVTDCSSCSFHLTDVGLYSVNSQPVYEFSEFLVSALNPDKPHGPLSGAAVACHSPCHFRHGRKLSRQIRQIIDIIPGIKVVDIPGGNSCCGGGGTFSLTHRSLSDDILQRYTGRIKSAGIQKLVTVCPSCIMQISRGLRSQEIPVCHPAEMLHASYRLPG